MQLRACFCALQFNFKMDDTPKPDETRGSQWTFLTNHFHILLVLHRDSRTKISELAAQVGITQRAVQRIVAELTEDEVIEIEKVGRRNSYTINMEKRLRHPLESQHTVGELLKILG